LRVPPNDAKTVDAGIELARDPREIVGYVPAREDKLSGLSWREALKNVEGR
jgi:hypothetical protein